MFPDYFIFRLIVRIGLLFLNSIAPLSLVYTFFAYKLYPAPPLLVLFPPTVPVSDVYAYDAVLQVFTVLCAIEAGWRIIHKVGRLLVSRGWWDLVAEQEEVQTEERWRLWVKMMESFDDPWEWLGGMFLAPGYRTAPRGNVDRAITSVKMDQIGRSNVEMFIARAFFGRRIRFIPDGSVEKAEIHSMVLLLELAISKNRGSVFRFKKGRSPHRVFMISEEPIISKHHPFFFYVVIFIASELGNTALWLAGFRYFGPKASWPFPLFFMRGSRRALDRAADPKEAEKMENYGLSEKLGYWYHPGSTKAQSEAQLPILFFHGISGAYGPSPFLIFIRYMTGRAMFIPEFPYVTMRLAPPSRILKRKETCSAARKMLWRHGYGLTYPESDYDSETGSNDDNWRRGKAIVMGHSLGAGPTAWLLKEAPDIVAACVLIDPMSVLLYAADGPRNFFRSKGRTAGELFFQYFASERGINHFLSRHLQWTDSVIFGPNPVAPLPPAAKDIIPKIAQEPLEPPFDIPNYAQWVSPCPEGPFPTKFFYSSADCILNVPKIHRYLKASGFEDNNLTIMTGLEHAAVLLRPGWAKEICKAIDEVARAAEELAHLEST